MNGNPNGPCPQLVPGYDCSRWGSNMSLVNASWSTAGKYRAGGAISFGSGQSYGEAKHTVIWDKWGPDITLGITLHPSEDASNGVIVSRAGSFQLAIAAGKLVWSVTTAGGQTVNVTSTRSLAAGECYTLKLTYKSTTGQAKILFENQLDASALHPMAAAVSAQPYGLGLAPSTSSVIFGGSMAPGEASLQHSWTGAMEEIYLKNVSTEDREVYICKHNSPLPLLFLCVLTASTDCMLVWCVQSNCAAPRRHRQCTAHLSRQRPRLRSLDCPRSHILRHRDEQHFERQWRELRHHSVGWL